MSDIINGFLPFFQKNSKVLILGSFPSVKSRAYGFYYGNRQNRFWKMLYSFFGEEYTEEVDARKDLLARHRIALWDVVQSCRIVGSADATIRDYTVADIGLLLASAPITHILLNGKLAYSVFVKHFPATDADCRLMPSTSPANVRYDEGVWKAALAEALSLPAKAGARSES